MCEKYRKLKIFEFRKRLKVQIYSLTFGLKEITTCSLFLVRKYFDQNEWTLINIFV